MDKGAWKATVHGVTDTTEQLHFLSLYHYASPTAIYEFPGSSVVKNLPASSGDARDVGLIPVSGRSPGVGNGNPLQYFCLENCMDRAWQATVHGVAESRTLLSD